MPEQHRIGDRAKERCTHHRADHGDQIVSAGANASGDKAHKTNCRRHQIEPRSKAIVTAVHDGHHQRDQSRKADTERCDLAHNFGAKAQAAHQRAKGHQQIDATQQPAIASANESAASGKPQEKQSTGGPLQQDGGGIDTDHDHRR